jgi:hypothetical protein
MDGRNGRDRIAASGGVGVSVELTGFYWLLDARTRIPFLGIFRSANSALSVVKARAVDQRRDYCFQMILPPTIVAIGPPLNLRPSKGELRDLLGDSFTS